MNLKEIIEETIKDVIIEEIVNEVLYRLENLPPKALVIFTGGSIGFEESIKQINALERDGWEIKILLSQSAESLYTKEFVKGSLNSEDVEIYTESDSKDMNDYYSDIDKVIVPVLTMNTAAKIALGIGDNLVTNVLAHCLMRNIPIIAADNACDPLNKERVRLGMGKGNLHYINTKKNHLKTLVSYGIKLVSAKELYDVTVENVKKENNKDDNPVKTQVVHDKRVLTRADIAAAFHANEDLILETKTIITPAAKDTARTLGVKIII